MQLDHWRNSAAVGTQSFEAEVTSSIAETMSVEAFLMSLVHLIALSNQFLMQPLMSSMVEAMSVSRAAMSEVQVPMKPLQSSGILRTVALASARIVAVALISFVHALSLPMTQSFKAASMLDLAEVSLRPTLAMSAVQAIGPAAAKVVRARKEAYLIIKYY